jgi:hypothetical protein
MEDIEERYQFLEDMRALGQSGSHEAVMRVQITEVCFNILITFAETTRNEKDRPRSNKTTCTTHGF